MRWASARVYGLNLVGLRRKKIPADSIKALAFAFKTIFNSGLLVKNALQKLKTQAKNTEEVVYLIDFINKTERGITRSCR